MNHKTRLIEEQFNLIKTKNKTIEVRLNDKKRQQFNLGDELEITNRQNSEEKIKVKLIGKSHFQNFNQLYSNFPNEKFGLTKETSIKEKLELVSQFYSKEQEKELGVVGLHLELID